MTIDRTIAPLSDKISKPNFPKAEVHKLSQGIDLVILPQQDQPVILFDFVIPLGRHEESIPGSTFFASKMLLEGTATKSSADIANQLDYHGSHLEITPTLDHIYIRLYCLKRFFENQMALVFELIGDSIFPKNEFEKLKTIRVQQTKQQHAQTNAFAGLKFRETLLGKSHPYGEILGIDGIEKTQLDSVINFYKTRLFVKPTLFLAGAVEDEEISIIEKGLEAFDFRDPEIGKEVTIHTGAENKINWDNSVQSSIRFGGLTISKSNRDIHKLKIANELFGGFFGSRLMKNIREEKGLTYGISSNLVHLKNASYWVVGTDVLKEKTTLAIEEIKKEIAHLQNTPPSIEEVETLKNYIKGKWLMSFDSVFSSMNRITNNYLTGLTNQYWHDFINEVDNTTPEQISETMTKYFDAESAITVTVG